MEESQAEATTIRSNHEAICGHQEVISFDNKGEIL
jgi:hypothetical protein